MPCSHSGMFVGCTGFAQGFQSSRYRQRPENIGVGQPAISVGIDAYDGQMLKGRSTTTAPTSLCKHPRRGRRLSAAFRRRQPARSARGWRTTAAQAEGAALEAMLGLVSDPDRPTFHVSSARGWINVSSVNLLDWSFATSGQLHSCSLLLGARPPLPHPPQSRPWRVIFTPQLPLTQHHPTAFHSDATGSEWTSLPPRAIPPVSRPRSPPVAAMPKS